jgi:hypothetical protein
VVKRIAPLLALVLSLGACDKILAIPDRKLDPHLLCADGSCQCAAGFMSCDGTDDNGCETDVTQPNNCGGCNVVCNNAACTGSGCQCNAGYQDCDGSPANGCETFVEGDAANCASCGHSCLGGECRGGLCQAVVLAKGISPWDMGLGAQDVYFTTDTGLSRVPKTGGAVEEMVAQQSGGGLLAVGPDAVYWSDYPVVHATPFDLSQPTTKFADLVAPDWRMTLCGGSVCWLESQNAMPRLVRVPLMGGMVTGIPVSQYETGIVTDKSRAYWATVAGDLVAMDHDKTSVNTLATNVLAYGVAVNASNVYFNDDQGIYAVPLAGGKPLPVLMTDEAEYLVADDKYVFFSSWATGAIQRVPVGGGEVVSLFPGSANFVYVIAIDDQAVYWASDGGIMRVAK